MTSAISVKDRLKNLAIANGKTMQENLTAYGLERTVYRLSISEYAGRFTLKGGIFLYALFGGEFTRATRDIDLLAGNIANDRETMKRIFQKIFSIESDDALVYDLASLEVIDITEFKEYHGVNVTIMAFLDRTRIPLSIDIGFGDVVYPDRVKMQFPVLLDMEIPEIYAYSIYSVISEKFEAIVSLGDANSRYKDFYDIYVLATRHWLDGGELREAIRETFDHRGTRFDDIVIFTHGFAEKELHQNRWRSFLKKKRAMINVGFAEAIELLRILLDPIVQSIKDGSEWRESWSFEDSCWKNS